MQSDPWFDPPPSQRRTRARGGWARLFVVLVLVGLVTTVGLTPWAAHMGGRWTPTFTWDGFGPVRASNGGRYLLFTDLHGGMAVTRTGRTACSTFGGCDSLHGTAEICTANGKVHTFDLRGAVHGWLSTDGTRTSIRLTGGSPWKLQSGWVVAFSGTWNGPDLHLADTDNSFTEEFTPRGDIRRVTSTADAGSAVAVLRFGSHADFREACGALVARG